MFKKQFTDLQNACAFAEAIVNTVREPLVVLDQDLRVVAASRSFYRTFKVSPKDTEGKLAFDLSGTDWKLSVTDNGIGNPAVVFAQPKTGLGTGIVNALAKQLDAKVETLSGPRGTSVSVTYAAFVAKQTRAA
jgi:signal transduction histidine kinase